MAEGRSSHTLELIIEAKNRADAALNNVQDRVKQVDSSIRGVGQQFQAAGNQINGVANQIGGALGGMAQSFNGSIDPLKVGLDQVGKGVQALQSHVSGLAGGFAGLIAAIPIVAALGAATAYLSKALDDSSQATVKMMQLRAAWAASERGTSGDFDKITAQIQEMAATSSQSAGSLMSAFKGMVTMPGIATENIIPALRASVNLAAASGRPLEEAAHALGYASMGWTRALRSFGMVVKQTSPEAKDFSLLIGEVNKKFSGQDAARMATYQGAIDLLNKSMGETRKAVGSMVEGAAIGPMQNLAAFFKDLSAQSQAFFKGEGAEAWRAKLEPAFQRIVDFLKQMVKGIVEFIQSDKFPGLVDGILKVGQAMQWIVSLGASIVGWLMSAPGWAYKALFAFIGLRVVIGILRAIFGLFVTGAVSVARYFGITIPWLIKEAAAAREAARAYRERNAAATGGTLAGTTGRGGPFAGRAGKIGGILAGAGALTGILGATSAAGPVMEGKAGASEWLETLSAGTGIGAAAAMIIPGIGQIAAAVLGITSVVSYGVAQLLRYLGPSSDELAKTMRQVAEAETLIGKAAEQSGDAQEESIKKAAALWREAGKPVDDFKKKVKESTGADISESVKDVLSPPKIEDRTYYTLGKTFRDEMTIAVQTGKSLNDTYSEIRRSVENDDKMTVKGKQDVLSILSGVYKKMLDESMKYKKALEAVGSMPAGKEATPEGWDLQKARAKAYYDELTAITSAYYEQERSAIWRNAASTEQAEKQITALKSSETLDRMKRLEEQYKTDTELRNKQRDEELSRKTDLQEDEKKQIREKYQKEELSAFQKHQTDTLKIAEEAEKEIQKLYKDRLDAQQKAIEAQISGQTALDSINAKAQTSFQNLQVQIVRAREETQRAIDLLPSQPEKAMQVAEAARQKWTALAQDVKAAEDAVTNASRGWDQWFREIGKEKMTTVGERWGSDIKEVYKLQSEAKQAAEEGDIELAKKRIEEAKGLVQKAYGEVKGSEYEAATKKTAYEIRASEMGILRQGSELAKSVNVVAKTQIEQLNAIIQSVWATKMDENTAALASLTQTLQQAYGIVGNTPRPEGQKVPGTPEAASTMTPSSIATSPVAKVVGQILAPAAQRYGNTPEGLVEHLYVEKGLSYKAATDKAKKFFGVSQIGEVGTSVMDRVSEYLPLAAGYFEDETIGTLEPFKGRSKEEGGDAFGSGVDRFGGLVDALLKLPKDLKDSIQTVQILVKKDGSVIATAGGGEYQGAFG